MKWAGLLLVALVVGCQSQHPIAKTSTNLMGDLSPVGSFSVERRQNFILPYDASIYIANPVNTIVTDSGLDVNALLTERMKDGFSQDFARVYSGLSKERFSQALRSTREMGAQFLVYGFVEQWANIKPIKHQFCDKSDEGCRDSGTESNESGEAKIAISIYESASGKLVDIVSVRSVRGISSYIYEDHQGPIDEVVKAMLRSITDKR